MNQVISKFPFGTRVKVTSGYHANVTGILMPHEHPNRVSVLDDKHPDTMATVSNEDFAESISDS